MTIKELYDSLKGVEFGWVKLNCHEDCTHGFGVLDTNDISYREFEKWIHDLLSACYSPKTSLETAVLQIYGDG